MNQKRARAGAWKPGQSGNPRGKPKGTRNKATMAVLALMEGQAETITQACIDAALVGDMTAMKLVMERLAPPVRERPILFDLPDLSTLAGLDAAQADVTRAVSTGDLLPGEGMTLTNILDARRRFIESADLERRISALEDASESRK
ncbi:DUF5681 domain-containing protein [Rhodocyclaceae bacterium SMB388]